MEEEEWLMVLGSGGGGQQRRTLPGEGDECDFCDQKKPWRRVLLTCVKEPALMTAWEI